MVLNNSDPLPPEFSGLDSRWQSLVGAGVSLTLCSHSSIFNTHTWNLRDLTPPNEWHGEDHLGSGTFGETSVWIYRTSPNQTPPRTTRIVLKIVSNNDPDLASPEDACRESFTQELLTRAKSVHVVRHYGNFKAVGNEVGFFMESCAGGMLGRLLRHEEVVSKVADAWFLELDLWCFFE